MRTLNILCCIIFCYLHNYLYFSIGETLVGLNMFAVPVFMFVGMIDQLLWHHEYENKESDKFHELDVSVTSAVC